MFVFGFGFALPMFIYASVVMAGFASGFLPGNNPHVHVGLVITALASPMTMALLLSKVRFVAEAPITAISNRDSDILVGYVHRCKVRAVELYDKFYVPRNRICMGLLSFLLLISSLQLLKRVFDDEAVNSLAILAVVSFSLIGLLSLLNWISRE